MISKRRHRRNFFRPCFTPANAQPPHFMKTILPPPIHAQKLRIPDEFVRRFGNELFSSEVTICAPDGRVWKMEMKKCENEVWFCKGWEDFVKYYSLTFGFFLVFNYEGYSQFNVMIFDSSAAEIHYPPKLNPQKQTSVVTKRRKNRPYTIYGCGYKTKSQKKQKLEDEEEIIDIEDESALHDGKSGKSDGTGHEKDKCGKGLNFKMRKRAKSKRQRTIEAAHDSIPANPPSFTTTITTASLHRYVDVPTTFWREYMGKMLPMKLMDSKGRKWKVNSFICKPSIRIGKGWSCFARANSLKEGDKCVFKLIKWSRNFEFQVTIYQTRNRAPSKRQRAVEVDQNFKPGNENLSFTALIKPPNLIRRYMDLPAAIVRAFTGNIYCVTLLDCDGKRWLVKCSPRNSGSGGRMWGGWIDFARAYNLKEGDVCVYELIQKKDPVFKVTIFAS